MNKEVNIYSFNDECYVYLGDYKKLQQENKELKEHIEKYEHYCKTTGIKGLMKENKKLQERINKAIEYINKMFETGFYNDDYYLGHLKMILKDKEVE